MNLQDIIDAVDNHRIRISDHADEEREQDRLDLDEIYHTLKHGEIIEDYPEDKPFPSCLVYGDTATGDAVHSVWAYNMDNRWTVLVTAYRPAAGRWVNWRIRREQ